MGPAAGHADPTSLFASLRFIFMILLPLGTRPTVLRKPRDHHRNTPFCHLILEAPQNHQNSLELSPPEVRPLRVEWETIAQDLPENTLGPIQSYFSELKKKMFWP